MKMLSLLKLPSRIAGVLAGIGLLGGFFSPAHAEAGFRKVPEKYQDVDVKILRGGPTLLFSDSPEMVYENGILYKDTVEGDGRVFFHHVNGTKENKKLAVLVRPVDRMTTITWGCRGIGDPDKSYYISAVKGQQRYFNEYKKYWEKARKNSAKQQGKLKTARNDRKKEAPDYGFYQVIPDLPVTTLAKGEYMEILTRERNMEHSGIRLKPEQLLTGMFDFHAPHPVEIVVMMCNTKDNIKSFSKSARALPMDEHPLRGTYRNSDLTYIVREPIQMKWYQEKALCLAGSDDTEFLQGIDAMTGTETKNNGNYGVVYHVQYSVAGEKPLKMGINPWGGDFYGAGMLISEGKTEISNIPHIDRYFGTGYEIDDIFTLSPNHKRKDAEFIWSPPGASNLPIRIFWSVDKLENNKKY